MSSGLASALAPHIESLVAAKRALGHPYESDGAALRRLDRLVADEFPGATTLTREIFDRWAYPEGGSPASSYRRATTFRQLARHIVASGAGAYVPPDGAVPKPGRYEPHIFTAEELRALFAAADSVRHDARFPTRPYVIPAFFRLLYCCGLRSSEARLLPAGAVSLADGRVEVPASKGWTGRVVYLGDDLLGVMRAYDGVVGRIAPDREAFFPNGEGGFFSKDAPDRWFHDLWDPLPAAARAAGNPARVHDLRHTHAVALLNRWASDGTDVEAMYPYLSAHLGHAGLAETDYYLHLAPSFYAEMEAMMAGSNASALPEPVAPPKAPPAGAHAAEADGDGDGLTPDRYGELERLMSRSNGSVLPEPAAATDANDNDKKKNRKKGAR